MENKQKTVYTSLAVVAGLTILALVFSWVAAESSTSDPALRVVTPLIDYITRTFASFDGYGHRGFLVLAGCSVTVLLLSGVALRDRGARLLFCAMSVAIVAQLFLVDRELCGMIGYKLGLIARPEGLHLNRTGQVIGISVGVFLYAISLSLLLVAIRRDRWQIYDFAKIDYKRFGIAEIVALLSIFVVGLVLRTYALNVITNVFEGEMGAYSAGATSIQGMVFANRGTNGPWSPLGFLYYLPIYVTTKLYGTTLVALRLSSVVVGMLTIPLVYMLAARLSGRTGGVIAAGLFTLNCLHLGWHRSDIYPHGATTWPTLLMCLFLIKAHDTRKLSWALAVAIMMGLSWHQYPSGQSAVALPIVAIGISFLVGGFRLPLSGLQTVVICGGVGLWVLGLPFSYWLADDTWRFLNPFTLTGPRAAWGSEGPQQSALALFFMVATKALVQFGDVLQGIFFKQPYIFHQEWMPHTDAIVCRTVAWLQVPFLVLGFLMVVHSVRRFESAVLLGWLVAAVQPGILSEHAYAKRLSTFYPALDIIAAMGLVALIYRAVTVQRSRWRGAVIATSITATFLVYTAFMTWVWFSGRYWRPGLPTEIAVTDRIKRSITPGTIATGYLKGYDLGKYMYLTVDHLAAPENRPNLWIPLPAPLTPEVVADPTALHKRFSETWPYMWTKLRDQVEETSSYTDWKKILFIFQVGTDYVEETLQSIELAKSHCSNPEITQLERQANAVYTIVLVECKVEDLVRR